jgi:hypothetical protein
MHVLLIVIGALFALFGGGCTLIMFGLGVADPASMLNDIGLLLSIVVPLGLLPLGIGIALIRWGIRMGRQKSAAPPSSTPPDPS